MRKAAGWVIGGRDGAAARLGLKRTTLIYKMQRHRTSASGASGIQPITLRASNPLNERPVWRRGCDHERISRAGTIRTYS